MRCVPLALCYAYFMIVRYAPLPLALIAILVLALVLTVLLSVEGRQDNEN